MGQAAAQQPEALGPTELQAAPELCAVVAVVVAVVILERRLEELAEMEDCPQAVAVVVEVPHQVRVD